MSAECCCVCLWDRLTCDTHNAGQSHGTSVVSMLAHRLRRWPNIWSALPYYHECQVPLLFLIARRLYISSLLTGHGLSYTDIMYIGLVYIVILHTFMGIAHCINCRPTLSGWYCCARYVRSKCIAKITCLT